MYDLRRVLVATDGGERGACAVVTGVDLARRAGARLDVVGVASTLLPTLYVARDRKLAIEEVMLQSARRIAEAQTQQAKAVNPSFHIIAGPLAPTIAKLAEEISADVIVVGIRHRAEVERTLVGSTAERETRMAPCPVLAATTKRQRPFRRVLAAVDFSPHANAVIETAAAISRVDDAEFRILHVSEPLPLLPTTIPRSELKALAKASRVMFERVIREAGCTPECELVERAGYAGPEILREARDWNAQLVVVGSQKLGFFSRMMFGSTSSYVLRRGGIDTIVVPENHRQNHAAQHEDKDAA